MDDNRPQKLNPVLKTVLEIGPIGVFFLTFRYGEDLLLLPWLHAPLASLTGPAALASDSGSLYLATLAFMLAIALSLSVSWALTRQLPRMAVVTAAVVAVFGGLTIWLQDETFIKMKPSIVNGIFGATLAVGLLQGRSYLKYVMGEVVPLDDAGWMIFTRRWVAFFIFMALLNELVWRTQTTDFWVTFKTFSGVPLTLAFMVSQMPLLQRHSLKPD